MALRGDPNRGLDPYVGDTYRGALGYDSHGNPIYAPKSIIGLTDVVDHIDSGRRLPYGTDKVITYGFYTGQHYVGINNNPHYFGEGQGYSPFSAAQKAAATAAIGYWDDLIPVTFVNVGEVKQSGWAKGSATILMANTTTGPAQAWTYYPGSDQGYQRFADDVWTATPDVNGSNAWLRFGGYGNTTLVHELGHSMGLSHPGAYNFGPGFSVTYGNGAEYAQDSKEYSIMSYWSDRETNALVTTWNTFLAGQPQTPMVHDIYTMQQIYGADTHTREGNTTYGFNSTAGKDVYNFALNPYPMLSIYDATGAHDKIDLSGFTAGQFIDLHPGSFSSIGAAPVSLTQVNADRAQWNTDSGSYATSDPNDPHGWYYLPPISTAAYNSLIASRLPIIESRIEATTGVDGINATEFCNFSIAYGTHIEDATGGSARDLMWGNDDANILSGLGGDDVIKGFGGNDTLIGGDGNDTFVFSNDGSVDTIQDFQTGQDKIDLSEMAGVTAANVVYAAGQVQIDTNGDTIADMFINSANVVNAGDYIFHA
jgi:serralysin